MHFLCRFIVDFISICIFLFSFFKFTTSENFHDKLHHISQEKAAVKGDTSKFLVHWSFAVSFFSLRLFIQKKSLWLYKWNDEKWNTNEGKIETKNASENISLVFFVISLHLDASFVSSEFKTVWKKIKKNREKNYRKIFLFKWKKYYWKVWK